MDFIDYCVDCDCNDPDFGCTMPSLDMFYACPYYYNAPDYDFFDDGSLPGDYVID